MAGPVAVPSVFPAGGTGGTGSGLVPLVPFANLTGGTAERPVALGGSLGSLGSLQ